MDQTRLGVGIVGTGRVGAVMGRVLREAGHALVGCTASSEASRDRAQAMLPDVPILDVETVVERSELVLFTVPDDQLADLIAGLATLGRFHAGQIVAHCAGRFGTEVLEPAVAAGAIPLALHPSLSFTGTSIDVPRLRQATVAVTAPKTVLPIGQALVIEMGAEPVNVAPADRPLYHAAISHAANHTVVLLSQALEVLGSIGVEDPARVLHALVDASVNNTLQSGSGALTGPVARGDVGTVRAHVAALRESGGVVLDSYRALARATVAVALGNGSISATVAAELLDAIE